jgi:4-amino-4-deoxy-L-arabinose transferase-like glycosyltransferase
MKPGSRYINGLLALSVLVNLSALFVTIIGPDGTLYASVAKAMVQRDNYIELFAEGRDWLDKPHFPFWITALSFKFFGFTNWAYKLPAVLFLLMGAVYTYLFARRLYGKEVAIWAVLLLLTAEHIILSNNDVRAEPYLTGLIIASLYHFYRWLVRKQWAHLVLGALFAGCAVMTKGMFALIPIFGAIGGELLVKRNWKELFHKQWLWAGGLILLFITPELFCLYYQFDAHPEKVVFGRQDVSGLWFFFWDSQFGRFFNTGPIKGKGDPFFFVHTLLWAFLPWSLLLYGAIGKKFWILVDGLMGKVVGRSLEEDGGVAKGLEFTGNGGLSTVGGTSLSGYQESVKLEEGQRAILKGVIQGDGKVSTDDQKSVVQKDGRQGYVSSMSGGDGVSQDDQESVKSWSSKGMFKKDGNLSPDDEEAVVQQEGQGSVNEISEGIDVSADEQHSVVQNKGQGHIGGMSKGSDVQSSAKLAGDQKAGSVRALRKNALTISDHSVPGYRELFTLAGSGLSFLVFSASRFQLPHYMNIVFPLFAILTAWFVLGLKKVRVVRVMQWVVMGILLLGVLLIHILFQPGRSWLALVILAVGGGCWYLYRPAFKAGIVGILMQSALVIIFVNFWLNLVFYPGLLEYQSGSRAAMYANERHPGVPVVQLAEKYSYALEFYLDAPLKTKDSTQALGPASAGYLLYAPAKFMEGKGLAPVVVFDHFHVSRLTFGLVNKWTRDKEVEKWGLWRVR